MTVGEICNLDFISAIDDVFIRSDDIEFRGKAIDLSSDYLLNRSVRCFSYSFVTKILNIWI